MAVGTVELVANSTVSDCLFKCKSHEASVTQAGHRALGGPVYVRFGGWKMGRPKIYDKELRNRLLHEAAKLLAEKGYDAVSLRNVTSLADTSTNAVYTLFGSREALMAEAILSSLRVALKPVDAAAEIPDPNVALIEVSRRIRAMGLSQPNMFLGAFDAMAEAKESSSLTGRLNPAVSEIDQALFAPILRVCQRIAEQSDTPGLKPRRMAMILWAALNGYIVLEISNILPEGEVTDEVFDEMIVTLATGWTAEDLGELVLTHPPAQTSISA